MAAELFTHIITIINQEHDGYINYSLNSNCAKYRLQCEIDIDHLTDIFIIFYSLRNLLRERCLEHIG